ncbi:hypothetical protein Ddye_012917 [Dipteronia dyeriana]|uniref:Dienelactone hydrolase domain-containing protein n=1 Tax=Dipteronia dyeriana TaxID=168575 RepID=A0AAD9X5G4_9ROSI|nr:hypothetical protein Ddye_012917 [Dipteronia dyeriana]
MEAKTSIQAHFGEFDSFVGFSDVTVTVPPKKKQKKELILLNLSIFHAAKALEEKLKASGIPYEVHMFPGSAHAFMNRSPGCVKRRKGMGMPDEDAAAVELTWSRFRSWMTRF